MVSVKEIRDALSKTIAYKTEFYKTVSENQKTGFFEYLFPTTREKLICKAVFDAMYAEGEAGLQRAFIEDRIDKANVISPMSVSEITEVYEQAKRIAQIYLANKDEYERRLAEEKAEVERSQVSIYVPSSNTDSNGFVVSARNIEAPAAQATKEIIPKKKTRGARIEKVDEIDLRVTREAMGLTDAQPQKVKDEAVLMARYEASLQRRRDQRAFAPEMEMANVSSMSK
ncbi:MAG: hypothetical protein J6J33_04920 [Clostridia bacterium]|nr:hypothetical protein [Clostridia bacterium]